MTNADLDEDSPIVKAIDRGGGQTCDIAGVLRELDVAGYVIVPKEPTEAMMKAAFGPIMLGGRGGPLTADFVRREASLAVYRKIIAAAQ